MSKLRQFWIIATSHPKWPTHEIFKSHNKNHILCFHFFLFMDSRRHTYPNYLIVLFLCKILLFSSLFSMLFGSTYTFLKTFTWTYFGFKYQHHFNSKTQNIFFLKELDRLEFKVVCFKQKQICMILENIKIHSDCIGA